MAFRESVGVRIRAARLRTGQTQEQVAGKLFVSPASICRWEKGHHVIGLELAKDLAEVLQTSVAYLAGEEDLRGDA